MAAKREEIINLLELFVSQTPQPMPQDLSYKHYMRAVEIIEKERKHHAKDKRQSN